MAVLKHIASKNYNYTQSLDYLLFQHNELTKKPILDEQNRMILRDEYYLDGINCEAMSFDKECEMLNAQYHKNQKYGEIKSHHYIISFDPKDKEEHGLTGERAQALGLEYAKKNFPGHQAIVCTHTDGHNGSGNIHVHIVINSLRKFDVERESYMERPCDSRAGYKHHLTKDYLKHLQRSLMNLCKRENLYQVDLLSPAPNKISDKEYWAARKGQEKLDKLNEQIIADGLKPRNTKFQTQKQFLRDAITDIASVAKSLDEFKTLLQEKYKITVTDRRGRLSFLHPERNKNISERSLGSHYGKEYLLHQFELNKTAVKAENEVEEPTHTPVPASDPLHILFIKSDLRLVVDLQNCVKAQQNRAYAQKVKISNLQQMAKTIAYVQENGYDTRENLQSTHDEVRGKLQDARKSLKDTEAELKKINEQIHYTGMYFSNKPVFAQMLKAINKRTFRQEHQTEIQSYEKSVKFLKSLHPDGKIPSMKSLKAEKEKLTLQRSAQYETYNYFKEYQKELDTVCSNVDSILGAPRTKEQTLDHDRS